MLARSAFIVGSVAVFFAVNPALAQEDEASDISKLMAELRLEEGSAPVRERPNWRVPKKVVLLGGAPAHHLQAMQAIAPKTKFVVVKNMTEAAREAKDADVIMGLTVEGAVCEPEVLDTAKEMRWIMAMSAGVERCIAVKSVHDRNMLITNLRGVDSAAIGEHAIAMALAMARGIDTFVIDTTKATWSRRNAANTGMQTLTGKTMLVVGLGGIGTEVAKRAHGIGMKVIATRASGKTGPDYVSYVGSPDELLTLASTADVVVNTAPLTAETTGIFNGKFFSAMKPTAFFINVARGASVVTEDLLKALQNGQIAGAGLDVVEPEPLPADHPLWRAPNIIISPHVSGATDIPREHRWVIARENLRRYVAGEKMISEVDLKRGY